MKSITERFTDEEFEQLKEVKGNRTWRQAILEQFEVETEEENGA